MKYLFLALTPLGQKHLLRHNQENADDNTLKTHNGSTCLYPDTTQFKDALRVICHPGSLTTTTELEKSKDQIWSMRPQRKHSQ